MDVNTFAHPPDKYGYRLNLHHPVVSELYDRFKDWKGIPRRYPLSDKERFEFEEYVFRYCIKTKKSAH